MRSTSLRILGVVLGVILAFAATSANAIPAGLQSVTIPGASSCVTRRWPIGSVGLRLLLHSVHRIGLFNQDDDDDELRQRHLVFVYCH
jgi:hypothetical protein